jgi:hypothetical protein
VLLLEAFSSGYSKLTVTDWRPCHCVSIQTSPMILGNDLRKMTKECLDIVLNTGTARYLVLHVYLVLKHSRCIQRLSEGNAERSPIVFRNTGNQPSLSRVSCQSGVPVANQKLAQRNSPSSTVQWRRRRRRRQHN